MDKTDPKGLAEIDSALRDAASASGITVTDGPVESSFDSTWRWHLQSETGVVSVLSVTKLALEEGADITSVVRGQDFLHRVSDAAEPRSIQILSSLAIRDKPIDSLPGE